MSYGLVDRCVRRCALHFTSFGVVDYTPLLREAQPYECLLNFNQFLPHVLEQNTQGNTTVINSVQFIVK